MVAFRTVMLVQMRRRDKFEIVVAMREARNGRFPQCNAGADVAEGSRGGCFSHCNAGADVVQVRIWNPSYIVLIILIFLTPLGLSFLICLNFFWTLTVHPVCIPSIPRITGCSCMLCLWNQPLKFMGSLNGLGQPKGAGHQSAGTA